MSEWKKTRLGDLYEVHNGLSKPRSFFGSGFPFLSFSTVFNNYFLPDELDSWVQSSEKERKSYSIRRGDVFITRTSETPEELGMSSVALKDYPDATYNGFCKRLRPVSDAILPEFAGYVMRDFGFRSKFYGLAGSMTSRASLKNDDLLAIELPLPPRPIQDRIAGILSDYDSAIANCRKQIALLEEAAMRLYREWFKDGKGEKIALSGIANYMNGYAFKPSDFMKTGLPILKIKEMLSGIGPSTPRNDGKMIDSKYLIQSGDIVFSWSATLEVIYWAGETAILNQHLFKVTPKPEFPKEFVFWSIKSSLGSLRNLAHGATMQHIQRGKLDEIGICKPPSELLKRYDVVATPLLQARIRLANQIRTLTEARDRLLPKLMKGEVAV